MLLGQRWGGGWDASGGWKAGGREGEGRVEFSGGVGGRATHSLSSLSLAEMALLALPLILLQPQWPCT